MLSKIKIRNYALIQELEVSFEKGFSAITGETGAGKSIILGALGLTLGQRVDTSALKDNSQKCIIETWFCIKKLELSSFFKENELDYEQETILRREILPSGKSRAFVNDTPVSLSILKEISDQLIDIHSQHQTLLLNSNSFPLQLIDTNAKNEDLLNEYSIYFEEFQKINSELKELKDKEAKLKADLDYFQFQFNELDALNLNSIQEEELKEEYKLLSNSEEIKESLSSVSSLLDSELGVLSQLEEASNKLTKLPVSSEMIQEFQNRISSSLIELKDLQIEIENTNEEIVFDFGRVEELNDLLASLNSLHQKHRTNNLEELIEKKEQIESNLLLASNFDLEIEKLETKQNEVFQLLNKSGKKLSESRKKVIPFIENELEGMLKKLSMSEAKISIDLQLSEKPNPKGINESIILFKANKGSSFNPLHKVASGGELSRLMLCIKANLAASKKLPTLIFDEIDTGVSGDIASQMGEMMQMIGITSQVISITHLPQIAGKGNSHYEVYKEIEEEITSVKMRKLDSEARVLELAKMLSGSILTKEAMANAKTLLN